MAAVDTFSLSRLHSLFSLDAIDVPFQQGGHPGDSESRGLFHVDRFWHLEDQIALCAEILSIRTLVLEQPAVDAARNLVAELDVRVLRLRPSLTTVPEKSQPRIAPGGDMLAECFQSVGF
jgi:hypothetical protein